MSTEVRDERRELRRHFIRSLYDSLESVVSPTPYLEITEGNTVDVRFLDGKARLPAPGSTEVTVLDMDIASLFFDDFHLLYEGETGVGKTYTSDALFGAVFGPKGHQTLRLSGGVLGSSALEPFTKTALEGGVPKTRIDQEKCTQYGGLFIDEINRGDPQEVFQVVDGKIHVNGDTGRLGIPIPGTNRYKGLVVIAAMNPADAQHSSALDLDIAGENRFLKFRFPNGVAEAASSQLEKKVAGNLHEKLWEDFRQKSGKTGGWRENYPVITDSEQFANALDGQTREFIDVTLGYVGHDPKETVARNGELIRQAGFDPTFAIRDDNEYKKIRTAQGNLKHGFVRRDLKKIEDLSKLLGFVKGVKAGSYDAQVNLNDVVASVGIVLEGKTITGTNYGGLMAVVNDARAAYLEIRKEMNIPDGFGVRDGILEAAINAGEERGVEAYMNTIRQGVATLNKASTKPSQTTLRSRLAADLAVLEHFSRANEDGIKDALKQGGDKTYEAFGKLYQAKKSTASIYEHRLGSIIR